jgi:hypothetical protein
VALPAWLTSQIIAAQTETDGDGTTWSAYATTDDGLVQIVGAHDRDHAQRWLDESGRTGIVAPSRPRRASGSGPTR